MRFGYNELTRDRPARSDNHTGESMRQLMKQKQKDFLGKITLAIAGMLIFSAGINFFIVPADLYNGGMLGISQLIRTVLVKYLHLFSGSTDIAGIINMIFNIPLCFTAT